MKVPGLKIQQILKDSYKENKFHERMRNRAQNVDTNLRYELQNLIRKRVSEGAKKEDIILELNSIERFEKFKMFFDGYVDNFIVPKNKTNQKTQQKQQDEEER